MNIPTIETAHLILRPFTPDDAEAYAAAVLTNPQAARALPTGRPVPPQRAPSIIADYNEHWDEFNLGLWAVILKASGALIGHCGLRQLGHKPGIELAFAFTPAHAGGDLPLEAAFASLRYGFETCRLAEILAVVLPENTAVRRVYERLGMRPGPQLHVYDQHLPGYVIQQGDFLYPNVPYHLRGGPNDPSSA
jgi:ribosomal-protein-alanine N-acetyltransferase